MGRHRTSPENCLWVRLTPFLVAGSILAGPDARPNTALPRKNALHAPCATCRTQFQPIAALSVQASVDGGADFRLRVVWLGEESGLANRRRQDVHLAAVLGDGAAGDADAMIEEAVADLGVAESGAGGALIADDLLDHVLDAQ